MGYDGPKVFRAPFGNQAAAENFHRTVLEGVPVDRVRQFTDRTFEDNDVRLWGTKETVKGSWSKVEPEDFLFFYRDGNYEYAAEVIHTEENEALGREIWPNHEEDAPWSCIIFLREPIDIGVDSNEIHHFAGYDIDYPMGFSPLNEMGIGGIRGKYGSVEELVYGSAHQVDGRELDVTARPTFDLDSSILDGLYFPNDTDVELLGQVESALNAGKHVIFTGPPGTGKTEIAERVCSALAADHDEVFSGFQLTTATADWSTFETVGGYMPEESGEGDLTFEPGQVLRRFKRGGQQRNELLVVDEINRADIDKAFGQLFTLLSGQAVQLPFKRRGEEIEILPAESIEGDVKDHQYVMPASWRIMATMNSYDKTSLYELSYAFMRRFAFIHVDAPHVPSDRTARTELIEAFASVWEIDAAPEVLRGIGSVWHVTNTTVEDRKIGPAIVRDMLLHVVNADVPTDRALTQAVTNYVFPQLEGVPRRKKIVGELSGLDELDDDRLDQLARDVLGVDLRSEV